MSRTRWIISLVAITWLLLLNSCKGTRFSEVSGGSTTPTRFPNGSDTDLPTGSITTARQPATIQLTLAAGYGMKISDLEVYLTDPKSPLASQVTGGLDGPLVDAIDKARLSIDLAMYSFNLESILYALLRAQDRGVRIRLVMENENMTTSVPQILISSGIPIVGDGYDGLMHNKFMVIDNLEVWTGSMNFTYSGAYEDNNNLVHIHSAEIAEDYTSEFEEMFLSARFGPDSIADEAPLRVLLDGIPLDLYFSPDDHPQTTIQQLISKAKNNIVVMAYSFTSDPLGKALRQQASEGISVQGLMDADQIESNLGGEFLSFRQAGLPILIDGNPGQMHHKVMILDNEIVVIGSYNFTKNAELTNDENLIVISDPSVAEFFMEEFKRQLKLVSH